MIQDKTSEEIWDELKNLSTLIKMEAVNKAKEKTNEIYNVVNMVKIAFNVEENAYSISYEDTSNPDIAVKVSSEIQNILLKYQNDMTAEDRDHILKSLILCNIQAKITHGLEFEALKDLEKQEAELI